MARLDLFVLFGIIGVRLLNFGVADGDAAVDLLQLSGGYEVLAHQVELVDDLGIILQARFDALAGEQAHAEEIVGELLAASGLLQHALIVGRKRLQRRFELRFADRDAACRHDDGIGVFCRCRCCRRSGCSRGRLALREHCRSGERKRDDNDCFLHKFSLY